MNRPALPRLPHKFRWGWTDTGARIFEDLRAQKAGGTRRNVGHFTFAVLRHVLEGEPLGNEKWRSRARDLQWLLKGWKVLV